MGVNDVPNTNKTETAARTIQKRYRNYKKPGQTIIVKIRMYQREIHIAFKVDFGAMTASDFSLRIAKVLIPKTAFHFDVRAFRRLRSRYNQSPLLRSSL